MSMDRLHLLKQNYPILFVILFYFTLRLINLTIIPIFNDEAIYLDWGWRETHVPGYLFYSLYDAKQPLLMWLFGIFQIFFTDPLFAGRSISVLTGFASLLGIYFLSREVFDRKIALLTCFLYVITPIFSFFDRQALMESAITTVGIWFCYMLFRFYKTHKMKYSVYSGIILGIGFFIKSSTLIFFASYLLVQFYYYLYSSDKKYVILKNTLICIAVSIIIDLLLFIQPQFWQTLSSNSRYGFTIGEIMSFPFGVWLRNLLGNLEIGFFYITPVLFSLGIAGIIRFSRSKEKNKILFALWFLLTFFLQTFLIKGATQRYLVSYLPYILLPAAYMIYQMLRKNRTFGIALVALAIFPAILLTLVQVVNPPAYFLSLSKFTRYSETSYIHSFTSGYGVLEAVNYLKKEAKNRKTIVAIAENSGNPESGMNVYLNKFENMPVTYLDASALPGINEYDCLGISAPTYFVSRDEQLAGFEKFFVKLKTIKNPYGMNRIGIYKLKDPCTGKTLKLQIIKT